jgi:hypothetical protein
MASTTAAAAAVATTTTTTLSTAQHIQYSFPAALPQAGISSSLLFLTTHGVRDNGHIVTHICKELLRGHDCEFNATGAAFCDSAAATRGRRLDDDHRRPDDDQTTTRRTGHCYANDLVCADADLEPTGRTDIANPLSSRPRPPWHHLNGGGVGAGAEATLRAETGRMEVLLPQVVVVAAAAAVWSMRRRT